MEKKYKNCQSCAIPLKKSPNGGGTNFDLTLSSKYCSYCYEKGEFKQREMSLEEMQIFVKGKMKELGFPSFIGRFYAKGIPKLERWKS